MGCQFFVGTSVAIPDGTFGNFPQKNATLMCYGSLMLYMLRHMFPSGVCYARNFQSPVGWRRQQPERGMTLSQSGWHYVITIICALTFAFASSIYEYEIMGVRWGRTKSSKILSPPHRYSDMTIDNRSHTSPSSFPLTSPPLKRNPVSVSTHN